MKFKSWPIDKKITLEIKDEAKSSRDTIKNKIMKLIKETLIYDSKSAYSDIYEMHEVLRILRDVVIKFSEEFKVKKRERNIIDFNDIEHYALEILVKKNENGEYEPTEVAKNTKRNLKRLQLMNIKIVTKFKNIYFQKYLVEIICLW